MPGNTHSRELSPNSEGQTIDVQLKLPCMPTHLYVTWFNEGIVQVNFGLVTFGIPVLKLH